MHSLDFGCIPDVWHVCLEEEAVSELVLARVGDVVQQGHVLVTARLGVRDPGQAGQLEPHCVAPLAPEKQQGTQLVHQGLFSGTWLETRTSTMSRDVTDIHGERADFASGAESHSF